jgi:hypothetical protein
MSNKLFEMNLIHFKKIIATSWQYAEDFDWEIINLKESLFAKRIRCFDAIFNVSILKIIMYSLIFFLMLFQENISFKAICFVLRLRNKKV